MPNCGSQITLCDLPIRFDTYEGCSHRCAYCFVQRKTEVFSSIKRGEGVKSLLAFINGKRSIETNWCDFDIPLHWGGMSDPFQPIERKHRYSLEALKVLAETKYPFVVSTKNAMVAEDPYLALIKECNCVVQFSACAPEYDVFETGASSFEERLSAARQISPFKRVIIRCQPYIPKFFESVKESIHKFSEVGAYGVVFEGIKYLTKQPGTMKLGGGFCVSLRIIQISFSSIQKNAA